MAGIVLFPDVYFCGPASDEFGIVSDNFHFFSVACWLLCCAEDALSSTRRTGIAVVVFTRRANLGGFGMQ
jgi:hypothetical protein